MNILNLINKVFGNWYVIGTSAVVAFLAAAFDQMIVTTWLYDLGLYSGYVFCACAVYIIVRTLLTSAIDHWKHRK
jgi:hypothetical protein